MVEAGLGRTRQGHLPPLRVAASDAGLKSGAGRVATREAG